MCIFCADNLIAILSRLCKCFRRNEEDIISCLEDALAAEGMPAADAVEVGMECVRAVSANPQGSRQDCPEAQHAEYLIWITKRTCCPSS